MTPVLQSGTVYRIRIRPCPGPELMVEAGKFTCLLGPNGAGKTTLLRAPAPRRSAFGRRPSRREIPAPVFEGDRLDTYRRGPDRVARDSRDDGGGACPLGSAPVHRLEAGARRRICRLSGRRWPSWIFPAGKTESFRNSATANASAQRSPARWAQESDVLAG